MSLPLWVWIAVAAIMLIAEIAQPTALYWPWTAGAAAAAACAAMGLGAWLQWGAFLLLPSAIIVIAFRLRRAASHGEEADLLPGMPPSANGPEAP